MPWLQILGIVLKHSGLLTKVIKGYRSVEGTVAFLNKLKLLIDTDNIQDYSRIQLDKKTQQLNNIVKSFSAKEKKAYEKLTSTISKDFKVKEFLGKKAGELARNIPGNHFKEEILRSLNNKELEQLDIGVVNQYTKLTWNSDWLVGGPWIPYGKRGNGEQIGLLNLDIQTKGSPLKSYTYPQMPLIVWLEVINKGGKVFWSKYLRGYSGGNFKRTKLARETRARENQLKITRFLDRKSTRITNYTNLKKAYSNYKGAKTYGN